jgi:hypothetical protein
MRQGTVFDACGGTFRTYPKDLRFVRCEKCGMLRAGADATDGVRHDSRPAVQGITGVWTWIP